MNSTSEAHFGNPSSIHTSGRKAKSIIESSRRMIAQSLHASSNQIIFTGSGTEANNSVLWSLIYEKNKHVVTSSIEHPAILKVLDIDGSDTVLLLSVIHLIDIVSYAIFDTQYYVIAFGMPMEVEIGNLEIGLVFTFVFAGCSVFMYWMIHEMEANN